MTESERRSPQPVLLGNGLTSQSGLARIRKPKQRERERLEKQHMQGDHLFPHLCSLSFILSGGVGWGWRGRGCFGQGRGEGGCAHTHAHTHSAVLFLSLLPGAVQFLDPSPPISSRLLLSISCSSLLPPRLPWSSPSATSTSAPGTSFSR